MSCNQRSELSGSILDGKYQVREQIGVGGTAVVFGAEQLLDGEPVAIKLLKREYAYYPDLCTRLRWEAEVAWNVRHSSVVQALDEGELADGSPYLVMQRVHGESLSRLLKRSVSLPWQSACVIARRAASVLHAVHRAGYVHRDLKPEHLWLRAGAEGELHLSLLDFGVCQPPHQDPVMQKRERGRVFGTPGYVAPEQASAEPEVDARADLYSLGATMFEMLTGHAPHKGRNVAVLLRRAIEEDAPPLSRMCPDLPPALCRLVDSLLSRNADFRPENARVAERALMLQLEDVGAEERVLARRLMPSTDSTPPLHTVDEGAATRDLKLG